MNRYTHTLLCILLHILSCTHAVVEETAEFCTDNLVTLNDTNTAYVLRSPNYTTSAHYNTSKDCSITLSVDYAQPCTVRLVHAGAIDCTERFRLFAANNNQVINQTSSCEGLDSNHTRTVVVYFTREAVKLLTIQLPAGYSLRVSISITVSALTSTTSPTSSSTTATKSRTSTITNATTSSCERTTTKFPENSTETTTADITNSTTAKNLLYLSTANSNSTATQRATTADTNGEEGSGFLGRLQNQILVGVGGGVFLLVIVIIALSCMLVSHARNRKNRSKNESVELADSTNGCTQMSGQTLTGDQMDSMNTENNAAVIISNYEEVGYETDQQQAAENAGGLTNVPAAIAHVQEEYASVNKPYKLVDPQTPREVNGESAGLHSANKTGSAANQEVYADAPIVPSFMPEKFDVGGDYEFVEKQGLSENNSGGNLTD